MQGHEGKGQRYQLISLISCSMYVAVCFSFVGVAEVLCGSSSLPMLEFEF